MKLENSFTVPVPRADAWKVLMDVERIAPCMPGATLTSREGDSFSGTVNGISAAPAEASVCVSIKSSWAAPGGFSPCSSSAATSRCTASSWFNCRPGSGMVKMSPVLGCS